MILHHSSYYLFGWLLLLTVKIRASWNLPTPPGSVGYPSSVLSYHCQLQAFFFFSFFLFVSFPLKCQISKGRSVQWVTEDEVIKFFLGRVDLSIYHYQQQLYLCVLDHGSVYNHPAHHRMERGLWAGSWRILPSSLYMSPRPWNSRKSNFRYIWDFRIKRKPQRKMEKRYKAKRDLNVLKWAHICGPTVNP